MEVWIRYSGPASLMPAQDPNKPGFLTTLHHVVSCYLHESSQFMEAYLCAIKLYLTFHCLPDGLIRFVRQSSTSFPSLTTPSPAPEAGPPTVSTPECALQPTTTGSSTRSNCSVRNSASKTLAWQRSTRTVDHTTPPPNAWPSSNSKLLGHGRLPRQPPAPQYGPSFPQDRHGDDHPGQGRHHPFCPPFACSQQHVSCHVGDAPAAVDSATGSVQGR